MTDIAIPTTNPILGIEDDLPERAHVLCHPDGRHACYCSKGVHCLLGFKTEFNATFFLVLFGALVGLTPQNAGCLVLGIDEALDLAKSKPDPCVALGIWGGTDIARMIYVK